MQLRRIGKILALLAVTTAFLSCAVTAGTTFASVVAAEATESRQDGESESDERSAGDEDYVLIVRTDPSDADVRLGTRLVGSTPLSVEELKPGRYLLEVEKPGYYPIRRWVEISEDELLTIELSLEQITGFLNVNTRPADAEVSVGGTVLTDGFAELPVGTHLVRIRRFGYTEAVRTVQIRENRGTRLEITLEKAPFSLSDLRVSRARFNPENPGTTGTVRISFRVTAPGRGELSVYSPDGAQMDAYRLGPFETWEQAVSWPPDSLRHTLPDGIYSLEVTVNGSDGRSFTQARQVTVDSSLVVRHRTLWSNAPGLLYAPLPAPLPSGNLQASISGAGVATELDGVPLNRFPVKLGVRLGLGGNTELTLTGGFIAHSSPLLDRWNAGATVSWSPLTFETGPLAVGLAIIAGGSYRNPGPDGLYTGPDTLTDFPGIFVVLPARVSVGPVTLSAGAEYHLAPAPVSFGNEAAANAATHYLYGRGGLLVEAGPLSAGASVAVRSEPFPDVVSVDLPIHAGGEIHWSIGSFVLSGFVSGEFQSLRDFYIMGGAGFSALF